MILVTGGTGFVGQALVSALVQRGHRVAVLTRRPEKLTGNPSNVQVRQGDLLDPESLSAALDGVATVVHLAAALPNAGLPPAVLRRINVDGTAHLARAAARAGVAQVVHGSSAGVYGDGTTLDPRDELTAPAPTNVYERSKLEGEQALRAELSSTSVNWMILRPTGVHGPGRLASVRLYRQIRDRRLWVHGPATMMVHPTYVADVVNAVLLTLKRADLRGEIINIAGPRSLTYPDLIELIGKRLGVAVGQIQFPTRMTRAAAAASLRFARTFGYRPQRLERLARPVINRSVDIAKAQRVLGFAPHPLETGIDATIAWGREQGIL